MADQNYSYTRRLCFKVFATHRAFNRFYQAIVADSGLTYPKLVVLNALMEAGPLTVSDLSARAGVESNTLSPLLKKMAAFGAITRQRDTEDERRVIIALTDKGSDLLEKADAVVLEGFAKLGLDYARSAEAVQFLDEVRVRLDEADPPKLRLEDN